MAEKRFRFWLVWNPNGRSPTYQHTSRDSANAEAERLASLNPMQDFIVLKAVGGVSATAQIKKIQFENGDGIPF